MFAPCGSALRGLLCHSHLRVAAALFELQLRFVRVMRHLRDGSGEAHRISPSGSTGVRMLSNRARISSLPVFLSADTV